MKRAKESKKYSLAQKTVQSTFLSCIAFGVVALLVAMTVYTSSLTKQYITMADGIARQAKLSAVKGVDSLPFFAKVSEVYESLSDEDRQKVGTEEYRRFFSDAEIDKKGGPYDVLIHMLGGSLDYHEEIYDLYLAMYDEKTNSLYYFVDPDRNPETRLMPGDWESVPEREVQKFLSGSETDRIYDIGWMHKYGLLCTVGTPIKNEKGETVAFMLADVSMNNILNGMKGFAWRFSCAIILLTLLISWLQARRIKRRLVEPLNRITEASRNFASGNDTGDENTGHFAGLDIHTGDELENLALTMANMEHRLKEYGANLLAITAEKERIGTELSLATKIQASMLPHIFPPFPERKEFDIYAIMQPAKEVGGDFYDFFLIDDDHLCLVIADVSGKGIPAALFMMISKTILQSCAMLGRSAAEILTKTNEALCSNNQVEMFVTVWLGILEISTGKLTAANAGHEYPVIRRSGGSFEIFKDKHSFAVGGMEGTRYSEYAMQLYKGDQLFLYTDGVPEANDAENNMFGMQRMLDALNQQPDVSPEELLHQVRDAVSRFVKDAEQFDDLTMLCIDYQGSQAESGASET